MLLDMFTKQRRAVASMYVGYFLTLLHPNEPDEQERLVLVPGTVWDTREQVYVSLDIHTYHCAITYCVVYCIVSSHLSSLDYRAPIG